MVREGYERVLKARLEDAKFFYEQDKKHTFDAWADRLQGVTFHEQLGSMSDKIERIRKLCAWNADSVHLDEIEKKDLDRAGYLCKTDLVSALVYEYPELQGVAGRLYAQHAQEKETICEAIEDHYKPIGQEGELPRSTIGAVLSCADKLDSLVGYFLAGITPSGNKDPLGLRRLAIGIVRIILQFRFSFNMRDMIAQAIHCYPEKIRGQASQITQAVIDFIGQRSESVFSSAGFSADHIHAVLESAWYHAAGESNIYDAYIRLQAIKQVSTLSDFELLSAGFKRADNIIKQAREKNIAIPEQIQETLFQHQAENILMDEFIKIRNILHDINVVNRDMHAYVQIFEKLITLKKPLDNFFNAVMIMDEDNSIRGNRLALLNHIVVFYRNIADFSRIITHASPGS